MINTDKAKGKEGKMTIMEDRFISEDVIYESETESIRIEKWYNGFYYYKVAWHGTGDLMEYWLTSHKYEECRKHIDRVLNFEFY